MRIRCAWEELLHPASTGSLLKTGLGKAARFGLAVLSWMSQVSWTVSKDREVPFGTAVLPVLPFEIFWLLGVLGFLLAWVFQIFCCFD